MNEGAKWAALGLSTSLTIAGSLLGLDVFESAYLLATGQGGFWDAMNIVASVNPIGRLGKIGGVVAKGFGWAQKGARGARIAGKAAEHLFKILPYKQAQKLTKGFASKIQAHHLLEVRHAKKMGLKTDDIPAVVLSKEMHDQVTAALRKAIPYGEGTANATKDAIKAAYQAVYKDYPEWLQAIEKYFP